MSLIVCHPAPHARLRPHRCFEDADVVAIYFPRLVDQDLQEQAARDLFWPQVGQKTLMTETRSLIEGETNPQYAIRDLGVIADRFHDERHRIVMPEQGHFKLRRSPRPREGAPNVQTLDEVTALLAPVFRHARDLGLTVWTTEPIPVELDHFAELRDYLTWLKAQGVVHFMADLNFYAVDREAQSHARKGRMGVVRYRERFREEIRATRAHVTHLGMTWGVVIGGSAHPNGPISDDEWVIHCEEYLRGWEDLDHRTPDIFHNQSWHHPEGTENALGERRIWPSLDAHARVNALIRG